MPTHEATTSEIEVVRLWRVLQHELRRKASLERKPADLPDDLAQEIIARFLAQSQREHIDKPYHWCRLVALRAWVRIQERDKINISYDGVVDVSIGGDLATRVTGARDGAGDLDFYHPDRTLKAKLPTAVRRLMIDKVTDNRDPAGLCEAREFLALIDPDWEEHMAAGLDNTLGHKLDRRTRNAIRRRARRVQEEVDRC